MSLGFEAIRFKQPGPPPLRSRAGHATVCLGLDGLSAAKREVALGDAVLWYRQLWLYHVAEATESLSSALKGS